MAMFKPLKQSSLLRRVPLLLMGMALAFLALGAPVPRSALAQDATGTITIEKVTGNNGESTITYQGFRIFSGTFNDDGSIANVEWANDEVGAAVQATIQNLDSGYAGTTAREAAIWISKNVTGTDATTVVEATSNAGAIANAASGTTETVTITSGSSSTVAQGWWLFVTNAGSYQDGTTDLMSTAPIFVAVGATPVTVSEKTSVPTANKTILEEGGSDAGSALVSHVGEAVTYRVTGTLPSNLFAFASYHYGFVDTLSRGLTYNGDAAVYLVNATADGGTSRTDVTSAFTISQSTDPETGETTLVVESDDVSGIDGISALSSLVLEYTAHVNGDAVVGGAGNTNSARIEYTRDSQNTSSSLDDKTTNYTFELVVAKVDATTNSVLEGAAFTIQAGFVDAAGTFTARSGASWLQEDGTLGTTPHEFVTNEDGQLSVVGVGAGTYQLTETAVPDSGSVLFWYRRADAFTITITPSFEDGDEDGNDELAGLSLDAAGDGASQVYLGIDVEHEVEVEDETDDGATTDDGAGTGDATGSGTDDGTGDGATDDGSDAGTDDGATDDGSDAGTDDGSDAGSDDGATDDGTGDGADANDDSGSAETTTVTEGRDGTIDLDDPLEQAVDLERGQVRITVADTLVFAGLDVPERTTGTNVTTTTTTTRRFLGRLALTGDPTTLLGVVLVAVCGTALVVVAVRRRRRAAAGTGDNRGSRR